MTPATITLSRLPRLPIARAGDDNNDRTEAVMLALIPDPAQLLAWLEAGWGTGAPPYDQTSAPQVWAGFCHRAPAELTDLESAAIGLALRLIGWRRGAWSRQHRCTFWHPEAMTRDRRGGPRRFTPAAAALQLQEA